MRPTPAPIATLERVFIQPEVIAEVSFFRGESVTSTHEIASELIEG